MCFQRYPIGMRSADKLGQSKNLILLAANYFVTILEVYLGSLSFCNIHPAVVILEHEITCDLQKKIYKHFDP